MLLDSGLPAARVRTDPDPRGTHVGSHEPAVAPVRDLVDVTADPHSAAPAVQRRLHEIGDLGLPRGPAARPTGHGVRLGVDEETDRTARPGTRGVRAASQQLAELHPHSQRRLERE